tara:strand:- start:17 stop:517 length:501 start_codon:yes stop_codon:yes gene_type:complete
MGMTTIRYDLDARSTQAAGLRVADVWRTLAEAAEEWDRLLKRFSIPVRFVAGPGMGSRAECLVQFAPGEVVRDLAGRPGAEGVHVLRHGFSKIYFSKETRWRPVGSWAFWRSALLPGMLHELGHVLRVPHSPIKGFIMHPDWPPAARRIGGDEGLEYGLYLREVVT